MRPWTQLLSLALGLAGLASLATPPYGDPNQPYDRLPGTLETYHVKWCKPNAMGRLRTLFIIPYNNSREVVEAAQRLDMKYTAIMVAGNSCWDEGYFEGPTATPLKGVEAKAVLDELAADRLSLANRYDVIVIAKLSWALLPPFAKDLLLKHVERGAGLLYLSPNRLRPGLDSKTEADGADKLFDQLFRGKQDPGIAGEILRGLPPEMLPAKVAAGISATTYGKGRVLSLDYADAAPGRYNRYNSLSPGGKCSLNGKFDQVTYDYAFALLARAMLWASGKEGGTHVAISPGGLPKTLAFQADNPEGKRLAFDYALRSRDGKTLLSGSSPSPASIPLPRLSAGTYFADLRLLDGNGQVLDFASKSFKVESPVTILSVATAKDSYGDGETVTGKATFSAPLPPGVEAAVKAVDTWGRVVAVAATSLDSSRREARFSFKVSHPLSELWDVVCTLSDAQGGLAEKSVFIGIPKRAFDDYMFMLIFSPTPGDDWKGWLYAEQARQHGINATFTYLIYSDLDQYEHNARAHLDSVSYAEHLGELNTPADRQQSQQPRLDLDWAEAGRMCRHVADTGEKLDPKRFPFKQSYFGADFINSRVDAYRKAAKFGSPYYVLTGENYLSGEFFGTENSGFGPTSTKRFQGWCKQEYHGDLAALNKEWNSDFKSWGQICGVMLQEAVEKDQMPRWVDFRFFMRSQVWSQFFIDWTDMMRRFIPDAKTGRCGHDHHDFSRYRDAMTCSKLYIGQEPNSEWRQMLAPELLQSFSGDRSFLLAPQSMIRWTYDLATPLARQRWPWMVLFLGLNGFDWERGMDGPTLGGESCFTPDYSEALPYFKELSAEVRAIQGGIGKLTIASKPYRSKAAMLWSPRNHYISRLLPFQDNGFSGTWLYNISVTGGAPSDCLALLNSIRVRPTIVAPEDLLDGGLERRGFTALFLPYSKGMSPEEAKAMEQFVAGGGLVVASNEPGTYSQHGKELAKPLLQDLFPDFSRDTLVQHGEGRAAYLPTAINGYVARMERGDFSGSDAVAALLKRHAGIVPPVELLDAKGLPRRDVFMPLFLNGSTQLLGLLRSVAGEGKETEDTTVRLDRKHHVWDVIGHSYLGHRDNMDIRLGLLPKMYALLPCNPVSLALAAATPSVKPGDMATINGSVGYSTDGAWLNVFQRNPADDVKGCVHVTVRGPDGAELEWFTQNLVFQGGEFSLQLPIAYSAAPGRHSVVAVDAITGMKAETSFDVKGGKQ